ncbi:MAG: hypothetical protein ACKPKO_12990, partial [Candidatus Fonsibacter sp.]
MLGEELQHGLPFFAFGTGSSFLDPEDVAACQCTGVDGYQTRILVLKLGNAKFMKKAFHSCFDNTLCCLPLSAVLSPA